ncbi:hypothetical protein [Hydrogenophaga sp. 2FB]|uniref:hypothetical protein n=1 Tax=Hydrogenophaga sp. 2FB TaxID=2502187 RepID=UPI0010F95EE2|nr:hypothetical protein [Hydrogenophaga sp. 2FB]
MIAFLQTAFFSLVQGAINSKVDGSTREMNSTIRTTMSEVAGILSGEINKSAIANKAVLEGLESYRQQEDLRKSAIDLQAKLELPANTCSNMAAMDGLAKASQSTQAAVIKGQTEVSKAIKSNTNTLKLVEALGKKSDTKYCSEEDGARGICTYKPNNELSGADQNALFLFQSRSGSRTFSDAATSDGASQHEAAGDYIQRMVAGIPPEQLRTKDMDKTPQGRAYIELVRRYTGMLSMSAYSLNQIREAGKPIKDLGKQTKLHNVEGFPVEESMSMNEAVRRFVQTQFSDKVTTDLATATDSNKILRAMATQNSFGLWMDYQKLEQNSRMEGMLATQLALVAEQSLRPQIDAQRVVASRTVRQ